MLNPGTRNEPFWKKYFPQFFLSLFFFIFLSIQYGDSFFSPNQHLFTASGDGIKNYYTYAYHIENDSSYLHFGGLNYPYGEHIGYTDGHPLLSWFLQTFSFLSDYKIGILNFILLSGMIITAILFYAVLRKYRVEKTTAVLASIGYTLLQPQIFRLGGHLSLGHSFFFLLGWYLFLLTKEKAQLKWSVLFGLNALAWFFIHPYAGLMLVLFSSGSWFFSIITRLLYRQPVKNDLLHPVIQGILPAFLFLAFMKVTDTHVGRTDQPTGTLEYTASVETVFIPSHPPFRHLMGQVYKIESQEWEGWAYIGISTIIILFSVLIYAVITLVKTRKINPLFKDLLPYETGPIVLTAILSLFFSMGYPFKWNPELLEYIGPVKQFRGLGRFAWIFFYVITIYSVIIYSRWLKKQTGILSVSAGAFLFLLLIAESLPHHNDTSEMISGTRNLFSREQISAPQEEIIEVIRKENITAILPLPWFHFGSEYYGTEADEETMRTSLITSYHSGIPLIAGATGRTSLSETVSLFSVLTPAYWPKDTFRKMIPDNRNILLLVNKNYDPLPFDDLIQLSDSVFSNEIATLYRISSSDLLKNTVNDHTRWFGENEKLLFSREDLLFTDSSDRSVDFITFNDKDSGFINYFFEGNHTLHSFPPNTLDSGEVYEIVYKYKVRNAKAINNIAVVEVQDPDGKNINWFYQKKIGSFGMIDGNTIYVQIRFRAEFPSRIYTITVKGNNDTSFLIDDLLIRSVNNNVYYKKEGVLHLNGIPLFLPGKEDLHKIP